MAEKTRREENFEMMKYNILVHVCLTYVCICFAGSVELAAVGISVSIFNLISKLFNVPLLNVTTSFVAEEQALIAKGDSGLLSKHLLLIYQTFCIYPI